MLDRTIYCLLLAARCRCGVVIRTDDTSESGVEGRNRDPGRSSSSAGVRERGMGKGEGHRHHHPSAVIAAGTCDTKAPLCWITSLSSRHSGDFRASESWLGPRIVPARLWSSRIQRSEVTPSPLRRTEQLTDLLGLKRKMRVNRQRRKRVDDAVATSESGNGESRICRSSSNILPEPTPQRATAPVDASGFATRYQRR